MSGGSDEYVMGNMSSTSGSYTYYPRHGGSSFSYSDETAKYIDTYANGDSYGDQIAYNRARLGDETGEVTIGNAKTWYNDTAHFMLLTDSWFARSGYYSAGKSAGVFHFDDSDEGGDVYTYASTRGVVAVFR